MPMPVASACHRLQAVLRRDDAVRRGNFTHHGFLSRCVQNTGRGSLAMASAPPTRTQVFLLAALHAAFALRCQPSGCLALAAYSLKCWVSKTVQRRARREGARRGAGAPPVVSALPGHVACFFALGEVVAFHQFVAAHRVFLAARANKSSMYRSGPLTWHTPRASARSTCNRATSSGSAGMATQLLPS